VFGDNDVRFFLKKIKAFFYQKRKEIGYAFSKLGEPVTRYRILYNWCCGPIVERVTKGVC
jgi:hypothetical protein